MKHIRTFESFINEAVDIEDFSTIDNTAAAHAVAKGKNFEELKNIVAQLMELSMSTRDKKYKDAAETIYEEYLYEQAFKVLIKPGMTFAPPQSNRSYNYIEELYRSIHGRLTGEAELTDKPELKNDATIYCPEVIVDGVSRANMNISIPLGYVIGNKNRASIRDVITYINIKGVVTKAAFWRNYFVYTKEAEQLCKDIHFEWLYTK